MLAKLRTLLFALFLTLVAMPDGITVCLRQLGGRATERGCCATCCTRATGERGEPAVTAGACARCCLSVPPSENQLDVVQKNPTHSGLAPLLACVFTGVDPGSAHPGLAARPELGRPRPPAPLALPLRI